MGEKAAVEQMKVELPQTHDGYSINASRIEQLLSESGVSLQSWELRLLMRHWRNSLERGAVSTGARYHDE